MTKDEVMKLALEALEGLFGTAEQFDGGGVAVWRLGGSAQPKQAITAIKEALAQPEQEPVAWRYRGNLHEFDPSDWAEGPVTPLFTAPPQREWVGMTDEERKEIWWSCEQQTPTTFVKAIEQALKEKNT